MSILKHRPYLTIKQIKLIMNSLTEYNSNHINEMSLADRVESVNTFYMLEEIVYKAERKDLRGI